MKKIFIREERCRRIFEDILGEKFPNVRPSWLLNKETGCRLELDGYCQKLKLAFNGNGNGIYIPHFLYVYIQMRFYI